MTSMLRLPKEDATSFGIYGRENAYTSMQLGYEVAYRIAKCEKPHFIAEELIKPCAEKMVEVVAQRQAPGCGPVSKECTPYGD